MKTEYSNAINVLVKAFPKIEKIYNSDIDEYLDFPYALYEGEFVPFMMKQLQEKKQKNYEESLILSPSPISEYPPIPTTSMP